MFANSRWLLIVVRSLNSSGYDDNIALYTLSPPHYLRRYFYSGLQMPIQAL